MRNDVKLGFAIGGVLLAVVIVFALVNSSKPAPVPADSVVSQAPSKPDAAPVEPVRTTPPVATTTTPPAVPTPPVTPAPTDAFARTTTPATPAAITTDPWHDALTTGRLPAPPALMNTGTTPAGTSTPPVTVTRTTPPESPSVARSNEPEALPGTTRARVPLAGPQGDADDAIPRDVRGSATTLTPPARTTLTSPAVSARTHTIKSGETFSTIATAYYGHIKYANLIAKANPGVDSSRLKIGQVINLPAFDPKVETAAKPAPAAVDGKTQYRVQANDSLYSISMKLYGNARQVDAIYTANKATIGPDPRKLKLDMVLTLPTPPSVAQK